MTKVNATRGRLKPGEPRTLADRLADLIEARGSAIGLTSTFSQSDRDLIVQALRTKTLFDDALKVCKAVTKASMSSSRPSVGESSIGWQEGDKVDKNEVLRVARNVVLMARALNSDGGL